MGGERGPDGLGDFPTGLNLTGRKDAAPNGQVSTYAT
jgi:hypothetical protein